MRDSNPQEPRSERGAYSIPPTRRSTPHPGIPAAPGRSGVQLWAGIPFACAVRCKSNEPGRCGPGSSTMRLSHHRCFDRSVNGSGSCWVPARLKPSITHFRLSHARSGYRWLRSIWSAFLFILCSLFVLSSMRSPVFQRGSRCPVFSRASGSPAPHEEVPFVRFFLIVLAHFGHQDGSDPGRVASLRKIFLSSSRAPC